MSASLGRSLSLTLGMIQFKHSVFALPFALTSLLYAAQGRPSLRQFVLTVLCMVTARNAAMSFNRLVDRDIDALNPRTRSRALPAGLLSARFCGIFCAANAASFLVFAAFFNPLTALLAPAALAVVLGYSFAKRVTHGTQFFLGLALGIAPPAAWIAATGEISAFAVLLGFGVMLWVAGFDLIYSAQDHDFDKAHGLKNLTVRLGVAAALKLSRLLHVTALAVLAIAGAVAGAGAWYFTGLAVVAAFLVYEHTLVRADDLSRVDAAFFTINGYVSIAFLVFASIDLYL